MIKEVIVSLIVGTSPPISMGAEACLAARNNIIDKGGEAQCIMPMNDTKAIEAQIVEQLKELESIRKEMVLLTAISIKSSWCRTVQRNGSAPTDPYAFSKVKRYWPEGIKPTLAKCINLIGGRRDPVTWDDPEKVVAQLKRGYQ